MCSNAFCNLLYADSEGADYVATARRNKKKFTSDSSETAGLPTLPGLETGDALRLIDPACAELSRLWVMLIVTSRGTTYLLCSLVSAESHGTGLLRRIAHNVRGCEGISRWTHPELYGPSLCAVRT